MNNVNFSTFDRDQDQWSDGNCAQVLHGAWWYRDCSNANPNGPYPTPGTDDDRSMYYNAFRGRTESLLTMKLMFR